MTSKLPAPSVVLLHDQLQDALVWSRLEEQVAAFATVQTLQVPPMRTLGPPAAWADHIGRCAHAAISPATADLVVTIGGAGEAGVRLASDGLARATLLLNPDPKVIISDATASGPETAQQLLRAPEVVDKLVHFFQALHPDVVEELTTRGTLPEDGIASLVAASLGTDEHLSEPDRELLRRIATEQLTATLPLDLEAQRRGLPDRPAWVSLLASVPDRCVIAITADPLNDQLAGELARRAPWVRVVTLASPSSSVWLHTPDEVSALIQGLLQPPPIRAE